MIQNDKSVVLVVDDVPENVKLLSSLLRAADYEALTASNGLTAIEIARAAQPDLVLLDIAMPGLDGYAVCRQLKETASTQHIPVVFVTARDDVEAEARGLAVGGADFITKPIVVPTVLARIKAQLSQYRRQRHLESMFRDVVESAPDAVVLTDTQGQIARVNLRAEQLFGYPRQALVGSPVEVLIPPRLRHRHEAHHAEYLQRPNQLMMGLAVQCLRQDGTEFPAEINLSPLQTDDGALLMAVVRDVSERQQTQSELRKSRQQVRELAAQNEATREGERKHVAREVHDELGQVLTALRMDLSLLGMLSGARDPILADTVNDMKGLVDRAIQGVRNVAMHLRPSALDLGLVPAIEWLSVEFTRHTTVPCGLQVLAQGIELDETRAVVVFRIVQESLTNITRYAKSSQVEITLDRRGADVWLQVRDDGQGFDPGGVTRRKSFGLLGMRERALALGGSVDIASAPGQGTVISLSIPLAAELAKEGS